MLLGVFLFDDLTQYNQYLGPIFFWSFVMLVYFAVLAAFIAFILDAFTKAKRKAEAEYDYLKNMLSARLRDQWSFARNRVSKSMARTRTQRMPGSMRRLTLRVRDAYRKDSKPHQSARLEAAMSHYLPHLARRERRPGGEKAFSRRENAAFGGGDHVQLAMIFAFFSS